MTTLHRLRSAIVAYNRAREKHARLMHATDAAHQDALVARRRMAALLSHATDVQRIQVSGLLVKAPRAMFVETEPLNSD